MSIRVNDFRWEKGVNDLKYIELLEKTLKNEQALTGRSVAKIRDLAKDNKNLRDNTIDSFAERLCNKIGSIDGITIIMPDNSSAELITIDYLQELIIDIADELKNER